MLAHRLSHPRTLARAGLLFAFIGATASACQKVPLVAPSGAAMTLVASSNAVAVNGATDITVVLMEGVVGGGTTTGGGAPVHDGTLVTFATTLGRLEPSQARTVAGRATVRLIADGRSGTATVTAFSGAATETIELSVGSAAAARITVTASPQALPGTGGVAEIVARVEDLQGNGLSGVPVSFSTTRGILAATSALSNDQGLAATSLTTTQEATVTASAGGATASLSGTVLVTLKPRTTVSIASPPSATVGVPAAFTVTPAANAIVTNVVLDFGDGSSVSLGAITGATTVSHPYRSKGVMTVTARATDSEGGVGTSSTQVSVAPLQVTLSTTPASATLPQVGTVVTLTATPSSGAIIDRYEWNFGDGVVNTTSSGQTIKIYLAVGQYVALVRAYPIGSGEFAQSLATIDVKP
jgi:Bacterial Ig-like domain (group 1)/PKD domain